MIRSKKNVIILLVISALVAGSFAFVERTQQNEGVGDVVYSILSPDIFHKEHSGTWMLLDGSPLEDSTDLFKLLKANNILDILQTKDGINNRIPDARGIFIRGMNRGRDNATGDVDVNRQVGSNQMDAFQGHKHFKENKLAMRADWNADWDKEVPTTNRPEAEESEGKYKFSDAFGDPRVSSETRPRNIALYIYIKVSN